jgi:hypothetical protein
MGYAYFAARCDGGSNKWRSPAGEMFFESPVWICIFAKSDIVAGMLIARFDVQQIDCHCFRATCSEYYDACALRLSAHGMIRARFPFDHSLATILIAFDRVTGSPTLCHLGPGSL